MECQWKGLHLDCNCQELLTCAWTSAIVSTVRQPGAPRGFSWPQRSVSAVATPRRQKSPTQPAHRQDVTGAVGVAQLRPGAEGRKSTVTVSDVEGPATVQALELAELVRSLQDRPCHAGPDDAVKFQVALEDIQRIQRCLDALRNPIKRLSRKRTAWFNDGRWWSGLFVGLAISLAVYGYLSLR